MLVLSTYSPQLRERMTPEDWAAIAHAGPGEVRFSRGTSGFVCSIVSRGEKVYGSHPTSPRGAFDAAMDKLYPRIVSVLGA